MQNEKCPEFPGIFGRVSYRRSLRNGAFEQRASIHKTARIFE
ncbi:hypothetical protein CFBP498_14300 [Xanthomonas hortorum pv. vitians]|uniref:Uncharacterized protein n=1 Tax=Xanthomonas hortorum pv. vitians TaxID=83224 RepID=A0A6V7CMV6_9XANT|nr:hypothetical protein CFBP498_14300 [Xanthomonas hortorum pv. vitians]CAD0317929.1 hypothetical protein CFBP498_14300 [Xanthomonas hortorum pv. vitians]